VAEIRKRWPGQSGLTVIPDRETSPLVRLSLILEEITGADSIRTVGTHYHDPDRPDLRSFLCVFPGCKHRSKSAAVMWKHVHFSAKHLPRSFAGFRDPFAIIDAVEGRLPRWLW
jgi:hypothetical protein